MNCNPVFPETTRGAARAAGRLSGRSGFTLFEVALSLGLMAFGIISVIMLFPMGIKAQQLSRFQVYASAKALEMIDAYNSFPTAEPSLESEAPNPWDVSTGRCNTAFDLERRLASFRFGIMPLPTSIAKRIDSDGDEIRGVLAEGGYLYYAQPMATTGFMETGMPGAPPTEAQRLVFTVEGYAQSNAIAVFPWKAWPYYIPYPSPPLHITHGSEPGFSEPVNAVMTDGGKRGILIEDTFDPDMRPVYRWPVVTPGAGTPTYGYYYHWANRNPTTAIAYCQAALWYCKKKFPAQTSFYDRITVLTDFDPTATSATERWKQVQALRFLSHALTCLTTYYSQSDLVSGVPIPPVDVTGTGTLSEAFTATEAKILVLHDSCMNLAMRFAASYPYDWSVPRPLERTIMMDHPLIEYDLFPPDKASMLTGTIWRSTPAQTAYQWRPVAAQPITNIGRSAQFSNQDIPSSDAAWQWWGSGGSGPTNFWGNTAHFTLTNAFTADERCRQLVFWAVDWQSYEDVETAPSAPVDAARYPRGAPRWTNGAPASFTDLMTHPPFFDWQQYTRRNPEKVMLFRDPNVPTWPTGADVSKAIIGSEGGPNGAVARDDQYGWSANALSIFPGLYGADRNFNHKLDRGPVPRSVRMRAVSVARFNFYDLRVPAAIR